MDNDNFDGSVRLTALDLAVKAEAEMGEPPAEWLARRLEDLIRMVSDWVWEADADFRFRYVSGRAQDVLGYWPQGLWGRTFYELGEFLDGEDQPLLLDWRAPFRNVVYRIRDAHGDDRYFLVSGVPVFASRCGRFAGVRGTAEDITERRISERRTRAALDEKEALLREVHHRVKNNMQVVNSLLRLQARQIDNADVETALADCRDRISAMSLIHETLYRSSSLARVDFRDYVENLMESLWRAYGMNAGHISWNTKIAPISLVLDEAVPVGLIINELVSNSLKHAFPEGARGKISVFLRHCQKGLVELVVSDDGIGMPSEPKLPETRGLGLRLLKTLAEDQLQGTVTIGGTIGSRVTVRFEARLVS